MRDNEETLKSANYQPKFMEWGIINKNNFTSVREVPIKRWDPLSTVVIKTGEFGLRKKHLRYYGHYSYLSPIRGRRPKGFKTSEKKKDFYDYSKKSINNVKDVFKAVTDGKALHDNNGRLIGDGYTIIITEDEKRRDDPFLDQPHGIEKIPDSCKAITLINRYPSMARIIEPSIKTSIENKLPPNSKLSIGINLVSLSRHFYFSSNFDLIPEDAISGIFISMKSAILYSIQEAIDRDYYDIPVNVFFNIGVKVGGSQPRIHGQCYIDLNGDGHGSRLEGYLRAFKEMGDNCHLCETTHGNCDRIVLDTKFWTFFLTGSPVRNYHLRFNPKEHIRRFVQLKSNQIQDLAKSLKKIFKALDNLKIDNNRNILFNCCPYGYDADFHMFADIIPHEIIGGAEMADDMRVARKLPEDAAKEIREAISS